VAGGCQFLDALVVGATTGEHHGQLGQHGATSVLVLSGAEHRKEELVGGDVGVPGRLDRRHPTDGDVEESADEIDPGSPRVGGFDQADECRCRRARSR